MRWRWGTFSLLHLISPLAANRTVRWADDDGQIGLVDSASQTFTAVVPFRKVTTSYQPVVLAGALNFTLATSFKTPGSTTYYRVAADGVNIPAYGAGIKIANGDTQFDGRAGVMNVLKFSWDGVDAWVEVWQERGAMPALSSIALTFPTRGGNTITNVGNLYTPASSAGSFDSFMSSAQAIPQNKAGRITVKVNDVAMVALCDTPAAESWSTGNFEYYAWTGSTAFSGTGAAVVDGAQAITNPGWLRMTRSSSGTVTVEQSSNGTTWSLYRTFATTSLVPLWVTCNLSGLGQKTLQVIAFEVEL